MSYCCLFAFLCVSARVHEFVRARMCAHVETKQELYNLEILRRSDEHLMVHDFALKSLSFLCNNHGLKSRSARRQLQPIFFFRVLRLHTDLFIV